MTIFEGAHMSLLLILAAAVIGAAVTMRGLRLSLTWLVESVTRISELEREKLAQLAKIANSGAPDALVTRMGEMETALSGQKMLVADAVDRVTALANRVAARQRRDRADDLDEEPEPGPTPQQAAALVKLIQEGNGNPPTAAPGPGGTLKERAKMHRAQRG